MKNRDAVDAGLIVIAILMSAAAAYGAHEMGVQHGREQMKEALVKMAVTDSEVCLVERAIGVGAYPEDYYDVCE
jgi:pheromone shutdown protein TraB